MPEKLFLLRNDNSLIPMLESTFQSEDIFQGLLERFPELLTDAEFGEESSRRWILVRREAGVSDREGGANRWSLDHLFLDQDGVPTLVEIKRATDTRSRREVVAQMLDYAANAVRYWKVEELTEWFAKACEHKSADPQQVLSQLLESESADTVSFWKGVQANLLSGRIRMIFVADKIAPELERIVEFLNEQMRPAVVLAVELRPFSSGTDRILAPRIIGATSRAMAQKTISSKPAAISVDQWFSTMAPTDQDTRERVGKFAKLVSDLGASLTVAGQSVAVALTTTGGSYRIAYIRPYGLVALSGWMLRKIPRFESEDARVKLFHQFEDAGFHLSHKLANGEPNMDLPKVDDEPGWTKLRDFLTSLFLLIKEA